MSGKRKTQDNTTAPLPASLVQAGAPREAAARADEYAGCGGSYARDAATGERVLVARTKDRGEGAPAADKE